MTGVTQKVHMGFAPFVLNEATRPETQRSANAEMRGREVRVAAG